MEKQQRPRTVGIDYGTKRVGLAISDPLGLTAQPVGTYTPDAAIDKIMSIAEDVEVRRIVVGWPLQPDGTAGESAQQVQAFVDRLAERWPDLPVTKWDETYTSEIARAVLRRSGARHSGKKRDRVDRLAAAIILQEYLDSPGEDAEAAPQNGQSGRSLK